MVPTFAPTILTRAAVDCRGEAGVEFVDAVLVRPARVDDVPQPRHEERRRAGRAERLAMALARRLGRRREAE